VTPDAPSAGRPLRAALLLGAAAVMILRAPIYFSAPSFWAEEGTLYFGLAWTHPVREALAYRPAGYLLLCANLATTLAAALVHGGAVPLARAPLVTVLASLGVQLLPVAVIAWSRAPFWDGALRRSLGVALVLFGALTDEIWLNTINCQPWLVVATALLLLEPVGARSGGWLPAGLLLLAGLSAPAASALAPLFAWRAWRARTTRSVVQAALLAACAVVQVACLWSAAHGGAALPERTASLDLGVFAATVWGRTLIVPALGTDVGQAASASLRHLASVPFGGALLLALAAVVIAWLARGLRAEERVALAGSYVVVTTLTLLTAVGDKTLLLDVWSSSRYVYAPGVLLLLMVLGGARRGNGRVRPAVCALLLGVGLLQGVAQYRSTLLWQPYWPTWPDEVRAWESDPSRPLRIWPPSWTVRLEPSRA
jgi:hypothetical protein